MNLEAVLEKVKVEEAKKSDTVISLQSTIPLVEDNQIILKLGRNTTKKFTSTGLQSYLQKIDVPMGFFNKCTSDLKRNILTEFHAAGSNQDVMLRLYNDDTIRFMASSKYAIYDDVHIAEALNGIQSNLKIKEFRQSEEFFVIRAVGDEFKIGEKPYFAGIQIMNSEVGKSSVKAQFLLWEQVCTNGLIVQNKSLGGISMIHLGKERDSKLREGVKSLVSRFDEFNDSVQQKLKAFSNLSAKEFFEKIEKTKEIPQKILKSISERVPSLTDASSLDVMSAYTEAIQVYDWDARNTHETLAGDLLWESV